MNTPRVTFLLPVYNAAATLTETLSSILAQTLADFELLIIDDASTDATPQLLATFSDPRIRVVHNAQNLELAATLNLGLCLARADYVARIDADDLCLPQRAARQADFLDANSAIAAVGAFIETFSSSAPPTLVKYPTDPASVAAGLVFRNTLAHPAVMLHRKVLSSRQICYDQSIRRAQDYALWAACVGAGLPLANIPEVLLRYRLHAGQATTRESANSLDTAATVRATLVKTLGLTPTGEELAVHEHVALDTLPRTVEAVGAADRWLRKLFAANGNARRFEADAFARVLTGRFVHVARIARDLGVDVAPQASPFAPYIQPGAIER